MLCRRCPSEPSLSSPPLGHSIDHDTHKLFRQERLVSGPLLCEASNANRSCRLRHCSCRLSEPWGVPGILQPAFQGAWNQLGRVSRHRTQQHHEIRPRKRRCRLESLWVCAKSPAHELTAKTPFSPHSVDSLPAQVSAHLARNVLEVPFNRLSHRKTNAACSLQAEGDALAPTPPRPKVGQTRARSRPMRLQRRARAARTANSAL